MFRLPLSARLALRDKPRVGPVIRELAFIASATGVPARRRRQNPCYSPKGVIPALLKPPATGKKLPVVYML
jgi:hypothetical protein